jgi:hypothetical protein
MPGRPGASILAKSRHRGSEVRFGGVPELLDQRMALERLLDDATLNAFAAPMDEADFPEARLVGGVHVLFDDRRDVARREGVEIERILDRNPVCHEAL